MNANNRVYKLDEVFGMRRSIPKTYHERTYVDDKLRECLAHKNHIVVYGGTRQGKTCLRKHILGDNNENSIRFQCLSQTKRSRIYEQILKEAGATVQDSGAQTQQGEAKLQIRFQTNSPGAVPTLTTPSDADESDQSRRTHSNTFEIDPSDANDVIAVLNAMSFSKVIVLEDFHYLTEEVQREISFDLKAFYDNSSISVLVIGVWLEHDRLLTYNGDLSRRLLSIDADRWDRVDLARVTDSGAALLNIRFDDAAIEYLLHNCQDNVGLLQEMCALLCRLAGVTETSATLRAVGDINLARAVVQDLSAACAGRYRTALRLLCSGASLQADMFRWIVWAVAVATERELKRGVGLTAIRGSIEKKRPPRPFDPNTPVMESPTLGEVRTHVIRLCHLQLKKNIKPYVFDYDAGQERVRVVDSEFTLWLLSIDRNELAESVLKSSV